MIKKFLNSALKNKFTKQSFVVLCFRFTGLLLAYFINVLIAKKFGKEIYGNFVTSFTLLEVLGTIGCLGLTELIIKYTANNNYYSNDTPKINYINKSLVIVFVTASIIGSSLFLLRNYFAEVVFNNSNLSHFFEPIAIFLPFFCFHLVITSYWQGKKNFTFYSLFRFVSTHAIFLLIFFLGKDFNIFWSYMIAFGITFFIEFLLFKRVIVKKKLKKVTSKALLKESYPMMIISLVLFSLNWIDVLMLGAFSNQNEVANYQAAFKIASLSLLIIVVTNLVISPKISEMYSKGLINEMFAFLKKVTFYTSIITIVISIPFLLFPYFSMDLFFGENFRETGIILFVLIITNIINTSFGAIVEVMIMTKHQNKLKNIALLTTFINIILNYILIKSYGGLGCAISTLITIICLNVWVSYFLYKKYKKTFFLFSK